MRVEVNCILDNVSLAIEVREDIDCGIGDENGVGVGRHVHDEHMADTTLGAQSRRLCGHAAHQFVGVQTALHQHFAPGRMDQPDGLGGSGFAVRGIDDLEVSDVEAVFGRCVPDLRRGTDEDRLDDTGFRGLDGTAQGALIARVYDDGRHRWNGLGGRDQAFILDAGPFLVRICCHDIHPVTADFPRWRYDAFAFESKGTMPACPSGTDDVAPPNS